MNMVTFPKDKQTRAIIKKLGAPKGPLCYSMANAGYLILFTLEYFVTKEDFEVIKKIFDEEGLAKFLRVAAPLIIHCMNMQTSDGPTVKTILQRAIHVMDIGNAERIRKLSTLYGPLKTPMSSDIAINTVIHNLTHTFKTGVLGKYCLVDMLTNYTTIDIASVEEGTLYKRLVEDVPGIGPMVVFSEAIDILYMLNSNYIRETLQLEYSGTEEDEKMFLMPKEEFRKKVS